MTFAELQRGHRRRRRDRAAGLPERFMVQYKLSLPVTCPILALIGLALGATNRKDGKLASFVLGFGVIFVYYVLLVGRARGRDGRTVQSRVGAVDPEHRDGRRRRRS